MLEGVGVGKVSGVVDFVELGGGAVDFGGATPVGGVVAAVVTGAAAATLPLGKGAAGPSSVVFCTDSKRLVAFSKRSVVWFFFFKLVGGGGTTAGAGADVAALLTLLVLAGGIVPTGVTC